MDSDYQIVFHRLLSEFRDNDVLLGLSSSIFRLLEDLVGSGELFRAPVHIFPSIFASSLIHIIQIRKGSPHLALVCENRVRLSMFILQKFEESWPHVIWTRHFLECALKGSPCTSQGIGDSSANPNQVVESEDAVNSMSAHSHNGLSDPQRPETFDDGLEYLDHTPNDFFSFPTMPSLALNQLAEEVGLSPELFISDHFVRE